MVSKGIPSFPEHRESKPKGEKVRFQLREVSVETDMKQAASFV